MKKLLIVLMMTTCITANAQTQNEKDSTFICYCQVLWNAFNGGHLHDPFLPRRYWMNDEKGERLVFRSKPILLTYMGMRGWEYVETAASDNTSLPLFMFKKRVKDKKEVYDGFFLEILE